MKTKKFRVFAVALMMVSVLLLASCGTAKSTEATNTESTSSESVEGIGMHNIEMTIENYGTVKLELDGDTAPVTVQNFLDLVNSGFYNGLTFHRIMDGFMIQGGDPEGTGFGGSEKNIVGEFSSNGHKNDISHKKGVISMARSQNPNSASSQFFIMVADAEYLDGNYAAFGRVTEGQDVVDKIAKDAQPIDNNGTIPPANQPVITEIKVID